MSITRLTVGAFEENCWLLHDAPAGEAVLIDPGEEPERLCAAIARTEARLTAIWLTHAHLDHVGGIAGVLRRWPGTPVFMHPLDRPTFDAAPRAARVYGLPFEASTPPDRTLAEGDLLRHGADTYEVWHVPGHAPGHVAFVGGGRCFGGDVLFAGSVGRTDLPGSDGAVMERSLQRLLTLADETVIHPGHGPDTTIGVERIRNPFLNGGARVLRR